MSARSKLVKVCLRSQALHCLGRGLRASALDFRMLSNAYQCVERIASIISKVHAGCGRHMITSDTNPNELSHARRIDAAYPTRPPVIAVSRTLATWVRRP
eukprot:1386910-Pleurochrysis_carterae.AAC.2